MELIMTAVETTSNPAAQGLRISGKATVPGAAELQRVLLEALDSTDELILDVSGVTDSDPTFFQLLCAACRYATVRKKRLRVATAAGNRLGQLAEANGFHPAANCGMEQSSCLLQKEEEI